MVSLGGNMKYLLVALLGITTAFAQSEPVTRIKGDKDTGYKVAPNLVVPNKQATKLTSTSVRIETGNGNMLPDPSFESGVIPPSADPSVVGGYKFSCGSYGTLSVGNSAIANDGTKTLKMKYGAGSGAFEGICAFSTILPDNLAGTDIEFSFEGSIKYDTKICVESYQITPVVLSQPQKCFEFNETGGVNKRFVLPYKPLYRTLSMTYRRLDTSNTTTVREIEMDTVYLGKPKSDEAIVAKFNNTTGRVACTFSTLAWQGLGTVTNNLKCERVGSRLLINGSLNAGTVAAAIAQMPLPTNFGSITIAPTGVAGHIHVGTYGRSAVDVNHGGIILIRPDLSNLIEFSSAGTFGNPSSASLTPSNGNSMVVSSERFSFSASIPIAEWSDSYNAALAVCEKGPINCANYHSSRVSVIASLVSSNIDGWITNCSLSDTSLFTCSFASGLYTVPPSCNTTIETASGDAAYTARVMTITNTSISVRTGFTSTGTNFTKQANPFSISCKKQNPDYKESLEKFAGFLPMNDVKNTEWVVGYDYISNKPIYKRCHVQGTVINNTTEAVLATWGTGYKILTPSISYTGDGRYHVTRYSSGTSYRTFAYNPSNGQLSTVANLASLTIGANEPVCLEYTKP